MPGYETLGFQPPAPVVRAVIVGPRGSRADVPLLLDTGADISVVPYDAATAVGARLRPATTSIRFLVGADVALQQADLTVEFMRFRFRGVFLVAETTYGVIGRNVLNAFALALDGPHLEWSISS